jgi:predicted dehydrogenase
MTFHGESGSFRFIGEEILHSARASAYRRVAGGELQNLPGNSPGGAFGTGTVYLARALRSALEGDRSALSPAATFEDGLVQQRVLDAARSSHGAEGRWVTV